MIKTICDRCGKETFLNGFTYRHKVKMSRGMFRFEYDLCGGCFSKVREFIEKAKIEQTEPKFDKDINVRSKTEPKGEE